MSRMDELNIIEEYRKEMERKVNNDEFALKDIEMIAEAEGMQRIKTADNVAERILSGVSDDYWNKGSRELLSCIFLLAARSGDWDTWDYFYNRTRTVEGIDEVLYNLGRVEHNPVDTAICERIEVAKESAAHKELFETLKDGVQYMLEVNGIAGGNLPEKESTTFADIYMRTMSNCQFYEREGKKVDLANEIGVLRGIGYCMEIVGMCPHTDEFMRLMEVQQRLKGR